jgi:hypothetical protein
MCIDQKEEAMRPTKERPAQRVDRAPGADISYKLQKIVADIRECGHANLTRLTVLKKWFETPLRLPSFGIFIASKASRHTCGATKEAQELFREAREILADVDVFDPTIPRTGTTRLHARLEAFQNERQKLKWTSVRLIHDKSLFFVESGVRLYLWHGDSPAEGYHLAADYCEH